MAASSAWSGVLFPHALRAVREGYTANGWLQSLRDAGMGIRRGDGLKVFAEAKNAVAQYGAELGRPQNQVPTPGEAGRWPTKSGTGMVQVVGLRFRENVTGRMIDRFYNIKTADGMTREDAVSRAIEETDAESGRYEQTFIGAFHASASILVPGAGF